MRLALQTDVRDRRKTHHGSMSTATFTPIQGGRPSGATATASQHSRHRVGGVLRAVKVFAAAAMSVAVLGEYSEDAGVVRR